MKILRQLICCWILVTASNTALAHFVLDAKTRIMHLIPAEQLSDNLSTVTSVADGNKHGVYLALRVPAPLIYAKALAARKQPNQRVDASFLHEELVDGGVPYYRLAVTMIRQRQAAFAQFVQDGYDIRLNGQPTTVKTIAVSVHDNRYRPHFNALDGVIESFTQNTVKGDYYVGESVVDILLLLTEADNNDEVSIVSTLPKITLPSHVKLLNIAYDHRQHPFLTFQQFGQLRQPMILTGKRKTSFINYIEQGVEHILIGLDHVIFVLCLVLASGFSRKILWSVTGFTVGHSLTFALGAFGLYPHTSWFIPLIELVIAVSIIFAAILIFRQQLSASGFRLFMLTALIGLLHGYGFAFVFTELVGDIHSQIIALLGFNIGVEIGQLMIVSGVLLLLYLLSEISKRLTIITNYTVACVAILVAGWWVIERSQYLIDSL